MQKQYKEGLIISSGSLTALLLLCLALFIIGFFTSIILLLVGLFSFFVVITVWSIGRYSSISITSNNLVVGKESVLLSEVDKTFGVKEGSQALTTTQLGDLELGLKSTREGLRILGGSYGRPKTGAKWLVIKKQGDSTLLVFSTRHPEKVQPLLAQQLQ